MLMCAVGMWRLRYWAVLGFQTLLAIGLLGFSLALVRASNLLGGSDLRGGDRSRRISVLQARARAQPDPDAGAAGSLAPPDAVQIGSELWPNPPMTAW